MDHALDLPLTPLGKGELLWLPGGGDRAVAVFSGRLWVIQEQGPNDTVVAAGESYTLALPGLAVAQALETSVVLVFAAG